MRREVLTVVVPPRVVDVAKGGHDGNIRRTGIRRATGITRPVGIRRPVGT
jgi:hypothetical protein